MINGINQNPFALQTQVQKNQNLQSEILTRLATGRRINSGKDDPAGLIAATNLDSAITALEAESRSIERLSANANIADGRAAQLGEMMSDLRGLAVSAANTGAMSDAEAAASQIEIDSLASSIQRFAQETVESLDGIRLPDGGNQELADRLRDAAASVSTLASGGANALANGDFDSIETVISEATTAFAEARGTIGSYQKYTLESRKSQLEAERESLMSAHSQIMDVDYAEETSKLAQARVATTASVGALRIADQNANLVLNLLS